MGAFAELYEDLHGALGPQAWWPAESRFEVLVGAVLTQNAAWRNVEQAITRLRDAALFAPEAILAAPVARVAECIRPSGYYNIKTQRLRAACEAWLALGGEQGMAAMPTLALRNALLAVHGLGPESVDDVLLYGFERPVFVIDAYTRRIFSRIGVVDPRAGYDTLQQQFQADLPVDAQQFNEYHALIVQLGKSFCRPRQPRCGDCPVLSRCAHGRAEMNQRS